MSLLFAIAYWLVLILAAFGAVVLAVFLWFLAEEWWRGPANAKRPLWATPRVTDEHSAGMRLYPERRRAVRAELVSNAPRAAGGGRGA